MGTGMFQDLNRVLDQVSKDKGIPREMIIEAIETAFLTAARRKWGHLGELEAHFNDENGEIELFQFKTAASAVNDPNTEMTLAEARELDPDAQEGDSIGVKMDPSVFGRIAAQTAKQVIIQKVREAERNIIFEEFKGRLGELITGIVRRFGEGRYDGGPRPHRGRGAETGTGAFRELSRGRAPPGFFLRIDKDGKGPPIVLSRKNIGLLINLFTMEVPEIAEGIVDIRVAAREPGALKIAVASRDSDVDPVGACVGMKGSRVQSVVGELKGEKIDIVAWDSDRALRLQRAGARRGGEGDHTRQEHAMEVVVPDDQLSLAIGRRGQNVRLAAQLTGWNIDVYSETRIEQVASRARKVLSEVLEMDDSTAMIFYSHSFRSFEDIASSEFEDLNGAVPGMGAELLTKIHAKAKEAVAGPDHAGHDHRIIKQEEEEMARRKEEEAAAALAAAAAAAEAAEAAAGQDAEAPPEANSTKPSNT